MFMIGDAIKIDDKANFYYGKKAIVREVHYLGVGLSALTVELDHARNISCCISLGNAKPWEDAPC